MPKIFSSRSASLPLAAAVLALTLSAGYFALAWTEPSGTMPISVDGPITTGSESQTKAGSLSFTSGLTVTSVGQSFALQANKAPYAGNLNFVVGQDGNTGLGTATPATGSKLHIVQNTYKYLDTIVESALPSVRLADSEAGQKAYGILVDGSQLFIDSYSYADRFLNNYGSHLLTIDADGNINIAKNLNVAGNITGNKITANTELCVGSSCVNSVAWEAMQSSGSGGGGFLTDIINIPTNGFSSCDRNDGCGSYNDISYDPASSKLVAVAGGDFDGHNIAITNLNSLSTSVMTFNYGYSILSAACVGDWCCRSNNRPQSSFDASEATIYCWHSGGATIRWCVEGGYYCKDNPLPNSNGVFTNSREKIMLRSDGTYMYVKYLGHTWRLNLGNKTAEYGVSLPSVNGIPLVNLGSRIPYQGNIYQVQLVPDYDTVVSGGSYIYVNTVGYPFFSLKKIGSY